MKMDFKTSRHLTFCHTQAKIEDQCLNNLLRYGGGKTTGRGDGRWVVVFDYMHLVSNCCDLCNDERGMRCIIMKMF